MRGRQIDLGLYKVLDVSDACVLFILLHKVAFGSLDVEHFVRLNLVMWLTTACGRVCVLVCVCACVCVCIPGCCEAFHRGLQQGQQLSSARPPDRQNRQQQKNTPVNKC